MEVTRTNIKERLILRGNCTSTSHQIVSLPYRTVRNAALATTVTWTVIASASLPIWFTHHLVHDPGNEKRE